MISVLTDEQLKDRIVAAYRDECYTAPSPAALAGARRARRDRGRWAIAGAAIATAVAAVAAWTVVPGAGREDQAATRAGEAPWEADFEQSCREGSWGRHEDYPGLAPSDRAKLPPLRTVLRDGERALRVYAQRNVIFTCAREGGGKTRSHLHVGDAPGQPVFPHFPESVQYVADYTADLGDMIIGEIQFGIDRVDARLPSGAIVPGKVVGDLFVIWSPQQRLIGATLLPYANGALIPQPRRFTMDPIKLVGDVSSQAMDEACSQATEKFRTRAATAPGAIRKLPPVRFRFNAEWRMLWLYADDRVMLPCEKRIDGRLDADYLYGGPAPAGKRFEVMQPMMQSVDYHKDNNVGSWVFGKAPDGAQRVAITTAKGQTVDARLSGGFFAAWWPGESVDRDIKIVATTPDRIYTNKGGRTTSRPR